jgi:hypothetical protein
LNPQALYIQAVIFDVGEENFKFALDILGVGQLAAL